MYLYKYTIKINKLEYLKIENLKNSVGIDHSYKK